MPITADQFKQKLAAHGRVHGETVTEDIICTFTDPPFPADIRISDCNLGLFHIDNLTFNSLSFIGGSVNRLDLETISNFTKVRLHSCSITTLNIVETVIQSFAMESGAVSTAVKIRNATITGKFEGNYGAIFLENAEGGEFLRFHDLTANSISGSTTIPEFEFVDVVSAGIDLKFSTIPIIKVTRFGAGVITVTDSNSQPWFDVTGPVASLIFKR